MSSSIPISQAPSRSSPDLPKLRCVGPADLYVAWGLAALAIAIFFAAWRDTYRIAMKDEECSYALVAPAVILWLGWIRRRRVAKAAVRNNWAGLAIMAIGWAIYWYGYYKDPVFWRAGAVTIAVGAFVTGIGLDAARRLAPAIVACAFLVPVDPNGRYRVAEPLQTATADITQRLCELGGMAVTRAGNLLSINGVDVTIAEACNGMRMVLSLFLVCYVVTFTQPLRPWLRALLLIGSPLIAIVSNVMRLVPTIWVFGRYSKATAEQFHDVSGWVMAILAFVVLMAVVRLFSVDSSEKPSAPKSDSEVV